MDLLSPSRAKSGGNSGQTVPLLVDIPENGEPIEALVSPRRNQDAPNEPIANEGNQAGAQGNQVNQGTPNNQPSGRIEQMDIEVDEAPRTGLVCFWNHHDCTLSLCGIVFSVIAIGIIVAFLIGVIVYKNLPEHTEKLANICDKIPERTYGVWSPDGRHPLSVMYPCKQGVKFNIDFMRTMYDLSTIGTKHVNGSDGVKALNYHGGATMKFIAAYAMLLGSHVQQGTYMYIEMESISHEYCLKTTEVVEPDYANLANTELCAIGTNLEYENQTYVRLEDTDEVARNTRRLLAFSLLHGEFTSNLMHLKSIDQEAVKAWEEFRDLSSQNDREKQYIMKRKIENLVNEKDHPLDRAIDIQLNKFNIARMRMMYRSPADGQTWSQYLHSVAEDLDL